MNDEKKLNKPYNIGLDIGTTSVGWTVVDNEFNIIKKGNKKTSLWGVRLFDKAQPAVARRGFRSTRRRYKRRRERIKLLQEIFKEEINKIDPDFFNKLKTSNISNEDTINKKYNLTNFDKKEIFSNLIREKTTDKNNKIICLDNKFPTIYHLRKYLMETDEKADIRLIYLALHHIIKYRGNFNDTSTNFNADDIDIDKKVKELFETILNVDENVCKYLNINEIDIKNISEILREKNRTDKKNKLTDVLKNYFVGEFAKQLNSALCGKKIDIEKLLNTIIIENDDDEIKVKSFAINETNVEDKIEKLTNILEDKTIIIIKIKELYDICLLDKLFKGKKDASISSLMVDYYETHKNDLRELKTIIKLYANENPNFNGYKVLFKNFKVKNNKANNEDKNICLYEKYAKNSFTYSYENFTSELKKILNEIKNDENKKSVSNDIIDDILDRIEKEEYMPRITCTDNRIFPYQTNLCELIKIIEKQASISKDYKFLINKLEDGTYKIAKLLTFRIPYYVGPLVDEENHPYAWMKRITNEKITPFNFEKVVNVNESAKKFIEKMVKNCTYLVNEKCMPANSILYSKFKVLQEIKQIKVCNKSITDITSLNKIYNDFFLNDEIENSLTDKEFKNYLRTNSDFSMYDNLNITGYSGNKKFANNMQSYLDFFGKNGIFTDTNLDIEDAEIIIKLITVLEDKKILKQEIINLYPELENKIRKILSLKYKGWSNLSEKFLTTKYYKDPTDNVNKSIMDLLETTNQNFMQIYYDNKYNFQKMVKENNFVSNKKIFDYSLIDKLVTSPANKRGIHETLKIIREIIDYMGYEPTYISLEMARGKDDSGIKEDRKTQLLKIYENEENKEQIKQAIDNYDELYKELKGTDIKKSEFLLYFLQEGKCMYSGKSLGGIENSQNWEIDHILPQTLIKDDSIDNKVLVLSEYNGRKGADEVVPEEYRNAQNISWWKHLESIGMMTEKKYTNLVREKFTDDDIEGFINRQLVETRQIIKHVADIIKLQYKKTNIIYINSFNSSNYRKKFKLYKYRDLNDYHHAHDAYLAITLGIYQEKYMPKISSSEEYKEFIYKYNEKEYFKQLRYGYVVNSINQDFMREDKNTGEVFNIEDFTNKIENTLYRNDILISNRVEIKTGEFYKQKIYKNTSVKAKIRIKENMPTNIYGGYTSYKYSYVMLVKYQNKKKENKKLISIPIVLTAQKNSKEAIANYIKQEFKCENFEVLKDKIPINTELLYLNHNVNLVSASEVSNNVQFKFKREEQIKYKNLLNFIFNKKFPMYEKENKKIIFEDKTFDNYIEFKNYCLAYFNLQITNLFEEILKIMENNYPLYSNVLENLKKVKESGEFESLQLITFDSKSKEKEITKVEVITELFKMLKCNSINANLEKLNKTTKFTSSEGRIRKVITNATLIYKSPTGLREKKYEF